jgi:hypothetical protein
MKKALIAMLSVSLAVGCDSQLPTATEAHTPSAEPGLTTGPLVNAPSFDRSGVGPPHTGTGTWMATNGGPLSSRVVGNNMIIENFVELAWEGALVGTSIHFGRLVIHTATGFGTYQNTGEFTGAVAGCDGVESFTYKTASKGDDPVTATGTTPIVASTSTTGVVLSGVIKWSQDGPGGPYEITYNC